MSAKDLGPLDYRIAIVDSNGRPSPEFQRRWNTQRNNNALIGSVSFGSGAPVGTPSDGAEYVDISVTPYTIYIGHGGSWHAAGSASANPTAIAKDTAVNGVAPTFMRSDAAPAIQLGSASQFGIVKADGTTITASGGVLSSAGGGGSSPGALIPVQTITLGSNQASITFSNIPQSYQDLILVTTTRGDTAASQTFFTMQFNGDTGANYDTNRLQAAGAGTINVNPLAAATSIYMADIPAATVTAGIFGTTYAEIFAYASTAHQKDILSEYNFKNGAGTGNLWRFTNSAWWRSSAAITSLTLAPAAGNFLAGSTFTLYARSATPVAASPGLPVIQEVITTGSQASVTISGIPQTYRDLEVVISGRGTAATGAVFLAMNINNDSTTGHYAWDRWNAFGDTKNSSDSTIAQVGELPAATAPANYPGMAVIRLPNYTGTTFYKQIRSTTTFWYQGGTQMVTEGASGTWLSTASVNTLTLTLSSGAFVDGTVITVYGIGGTAAVVGGSKTAPGATYLTPLVSNFTWQNQGTSTATQTVPTGAITMVPQANASTFNWRLLTLTPPTTPYKVRAQFTGYFGGGNSQTLGLYFFDGTKFLSMEMLGQNAGILARVVYASALVAPATNTQLASYGPQWGTPGGQSTSIWLQIRNDGSTLYFDMSTNGQNFTNIYSEAIGTHITPTQIGWGGVNIPSTGTTVLTIDLLNWTVYNNASLN